MLMLKNAEKRSMIDQLRKLLHQRLGSTQQLHAVEEARHVYKLQRERRQGETEGLCPPELGQCDLPQVVQAG